MRDLPLRAAHVRGWKCSLVLVGDPGCPPGVDVTLTALLHTLPALMGRKAKDANGNELWLGCLPPAWIPKAAAKVGFLAQNVLLCAFSELLSSHSLFRGLSMRIW